MWTGRVASALPPSERWGTEVAEWRFGSWSKDEIASRLEMLDGLPRNFREARGEMTPESGWNRYSSEALIAREPPGQPVPDGPFRRMEVAVANYHFSDPSIVVAHFDAESRLLGRRMLLEMKALRHLHYLAGVVVGAVRFEKKDRRHVFGYRYDTLEGHIERGSEWFLLTKDEESGAVEFRIEAEWMPGDFPNWWSRVGFRFLGSHYQRKWHHAAHWRLFHIAHEGMSPSPLVDALGVAHAGPNVIFQRTLRTLTIDKPRWQEEETIQSS